MKKTKLICTIGPASEDRALLKQLMETGMDGARLNFSHGNHEEQKEKMDLVKELRNELDLPIPIILDTKGPEIRTGDFQNGKVMLKEGSDFLVTTEDVLGTDKMCTITYKKLPKDVKIGDKILIDDGLIELTVKNVEGNEISTVVNNGGMVGSKKGINVPGVHVDLLSITESDKRDILFGISQDVDFVAASFIRSGADAAYLRKFLNENGGEQVGIISKIENKEGIDNIDDILIESDGIMVARGDMGVEIPAEDVPLIQKSIIKKCNREGRFVITATQMLDSMIRNPRPTRAEVADVANAILDGSDAVMLSGETASGKYPLEAVEMMVNVANAAEKGIDYVGKTRKRKSDMANNVTNSIGFAAVSTAESLDAAAIVAPTTSGYTARVMAKFRPECPIIAFSTSKRVVRTLNLVWGVLPYYHPHKEDADIFFASVMEESKKEGLIKDGDLLILTAGLPLGIGGTTNMMRIHTVGQ